MNSIDEGMLMRKVDLKPSSPEWKFVSQILSDAQFAFAEGEVTKSLRIRTVNHQRSQMRREEVHEDYQIILDKVDDITTGIEMFKMI